MRVAPVLARLAAALAAAFAIAAEPTPAPDAPLADPAEEARAQALFEQIRCVVCQHESIADSPAGLAADVRREVRGQIADGRSDDEIRAALVARWGDFVLFRPPFSVGTLLLWLGPALLVLGFLVFALIRARRPVEEVDPLSAAEEAALAQAVETDRLGHDPAAGRPDDGR
ncbi:cytochrome c-type biogenesis protein [Brevundimonas sp.]|uniref:cytochrome c-type biogenesis protein n=1 Tax=Brevundimonas sp. TaxID=1871086 RepID=UPI002626E1A1|nr:cytochrome c-type biogenesis protein [Brevundimonas sp.]